MDNEFRAPETALVLAVLLAAYLLLFCGCSRTVYMPVETVRTDSVRVTLVRRDSVRVTDSVYIAQRADTVFREHWNTVYREVSRGDTVYIGRTDTVSVPYPVEAGLTAWQKVRVSLNVLLIVVACLGIIAAVAWLIYKKLKT